MVSYQFLMKKNRRKCFGLSKSLYLCTAKQKSDAQLGYGVMVTLQILVLSFLVRVQIAQPYLS